jgi:glycosyltransferase involved in cell wall biosynthesis
MKILMINKTDSVGGAAQVMNNLTSGLRLTGHEVKCLVRRKFTSNPDVYELPENKIFNILRQVIHRDFSVVWENYSRWPGFSREITNHPLIKWADVIHCHNLHGNYFQLENLIKLSKEKPVVWTWHDWWPVTGHCATPQICKYHCDHLDNSVRKKKLEIYQQADLHIAVPSKAMSESNIILPFAPTLIHNGVAQVNLSDISKNDLRKILKLPLDKQIISYFSYSRHNRDKGWEHVERLKRYFPEKYWLDIGYRGYLVQTDLQKYLKASDVFLFPSLAESFGMTPVEAICQGTPVVAFPVGIIPELVQHCYTGYIAKYGDSDDLVSGVEFVLSHKMKSISHQQFNNYSIRTMTENYLKQYVEISQG